MKPKYVINESKVKDSINQYRNINGYHYICWTADSDLFPEIIRKCKSIDRKYRIIKGEIYLQIFESENPRKLIFNVGSDDDHSHT